MGRYSLQYVQQHYGVPVRRGMRVTTEYSESGVVTCGDGQYVRVRLDGHKRSGRYHPLSLDYGDGVSIEDRLAGHNARIEAWNARLNRTISFEEYQQRMRAGARQMQPPHQEAA